MALVEGYFDESGDLNDSSGIFCVSGYMVEANAARAMDADWRAVLDEHKIQYFHMVDCAHEPPSGPFLGMNKDERSLIVRKFISIIKKYSIEGISIIAKSETYQGPLSDEPDLYSQCAYACVGWIEQFIRSERIDGPISYFFEEGHKNKGSAYNYLASKIQRKNDTVSFAGKTEVPLLQAADLLAWQTSKYVKDYFSFRLKNEEPKRNPRKDFQSLMEHRHTFLHLNIDSAEKSMGIETWPMNMRNPAPTQYNVNSDGPIPCLIEDSEPAPVFQIDYPVNWRMGGPRAAYIKFKGLGENEFILSLDERRLIETIAMMIQATSLYEDTPFVPMASVESAIVENINGQMVARLKLFHGSTFAFHLSDEATSAFREAISKSD